MDEQMTDLKSVVQMVKMQLAADGVLVYLSPEVETPGQLAADLIRQSLRMETLIRELPREFPLKAIEDSERVRASVQYQTFEEWLLFYAK
jgi:hypothetical protein